jgi:hypothetical protein
MKSGLLGPFLNVALLAEGRKSIVPLPAGAVGTQLMIAEGLSTWIVSLVGLVMVRVAAPAVTVGTP